MKTLLQSIYKNYFDKDKCLRHYSQHLMVAATALVIVTLLFDLKLTTNALITYVIFTYIIDIDGFLSIFIHRKKIPEAQLIIDAIFAGKLKHAGDLATTHHKKLTRLMMHNVVGFCAVTTLCVFSVYSGNITYIMMTFAVLAHFIFDICDDLYQMSHLKNWFWPLFWRPAKNYVYIKE